MKPYAYPKTFKELFDSYKSYVATHAIDDNEMNFSIFLANNGHSTEHAIELYDNYTKNTVPTIKDYKIRKTHPIRDAFLKKFMAPVAETAALTGTLFGALALAINTMTTNQFLWMSLTTNPALNAINLAVNGVAVGAVGAATYLVAKNALTKLYYNIKAGSSKKLLKQLEDGTDIEHTKLASLIKEIEATNDKILELREGKALTKPFRFVGRHILNIWNRNRIHHVEKVTRDLLAKFHQKLDDTCASADDKLKDDELKNLEKALLYIQKFVNGDIERSKLYALLSCTDNNPKKSNHTHKIENLDIYASMEFQELAAIKNSASSKVIKKGSKTNTHNVSQKVATAGELLNGGQNYLQKSLARLTALKPTPVATPVVIPSIVSFEAFYRGTKFNLDNGKFLIVNGLDHTTIKTASYDGSEVRIKFKTAGPDALYAAKPITKASIKTIEQQRKNVIAIRKYINDRKAYIVAEINAMYAPKSPCTERKLDNLLAVIDTTLTTSADFKLKGAALSLFNKVDEVLKLDTTYTIAP